MARCCSSRMTVHSCDGWRRASSSSTAIPEAERVPGYSYNWTPYGYFQDGAIGYKICDLPEANKPAAFAGCTRFGNSPALITPNQTLRSEEHTSELQSLMRISYAVFCLKKKTTKKINNKSHRKKPQ